MSKHNIFCNIINKVSMIMYFVLCPFCSINGETSTNSHQYGAVDSIKDSNGKELLVNSNGENKLLNSPSHSESWSDCVVTTILIFITYLGYVVGIISSQLTMANVLQINSVRFVIVTAVAFAAGWLCKCPLSLKRDHIWILCICVILHLTAGNAYYFTAACMPAGTFNGMRGAFSTVIATTYDFYKGKISKRAIISIVGAVIGIILLTQPWAEHTEVHLALSPCEYLENESLPLKLDINTTRAMPNHEDQHDALQIWFQKYKTPIGYILTFIISVMIVVKGIFLRELVLEYPVSTILFWHTAASAIPTIILNLIWSKYFSKPFFDLPSGDLCWLLTVLFIASAACANGVAFVVYKRTHVSTTALMTIAFTVFLYASQRTFLKPFNPGHANVVEVIGIIVISFSVSILRLISFVIEKKGHGN